MNREWCDLDKLPYDTLNKLDYVLLEYIDWFSGSVSLREVKEYTDKLTCRKGLAHTNILDMIKIYSLDEVVEVLEKNNLFWEINVNPGYEYFDYLINHKTKNEVTELFKKLKGHHIEITVGSDTHCLDYYDIRRIKAGNKLAQYNLTDAAL